VTSTPWGKSVDNKVWQWWSAESERWARLKYPTSINPLVDPEFLEEERESMDPVSFAAEYEAEWIDESDCWFPTSLIADATRDVALQEHAEEGWEYWLGEDPGHERDRSAGVVLGRPPGGDFYQVVAVRAEKGSKRALPIFRSLVKAFRPGLKACVADQRSHSECDYMEEDWPRLIRFKTTVESRSELYQRLKSALANRRLFLPHPESSPEIRLIHRELQTLYYKFTRSGHVVFDHPRNGTDDAIDSLAYALHAARAPKFRAVMIRG